MRAPYQTLIILYKQEKNNFLYGIFYRKKENFWQFISGGGEDGEQQDDTAIRELEDKKRKIKKTRLNFCNTSCKYYRRIYLGRKGFCYS